MNKISITIPTLTATWVDADPEESWEALASWDLLLDLPAPAHLGFVAGASPPREGNQLLAGVDLKKDGRYHWYICGLADELSEDNSGFCATLDEAKAEVHKRLGATQ